MAWKTQESALNYAKKKYGTTAFTVEHVHYKMVGFKRGEKKITGRGDTWEAAIRELERKAEQ